MKRTIGVLCAALAAIAFGLAPGTAAQAAPAAAPATTVTQPIRVVIIHAGTVAPFDVSGCNTGVCIQVAVFIDYTRFSVWGYGSTFYGHWQVLFPNNTYLNYNNNSGPASIAGDHYGQPLHGKYCAIGWYWNLANYVKVGEPCVNA